MRTQTQVEETQQTSRIPHWNIGTRIGFRFCFVYLGLFVLYFSPAWLQYLLFVKHESPFVLGGVWPMRQIVFWAGAHVFRIGGPPDPGVGFDGSFFWIEAFVLLIISLLATGIWSVLDRRRQNYVTLHNWLRVIVRFRFAALMFAYGMFKLIPSQMPYPNLFELVRPFGHLWQMQVLWSRSRK